MTPAQEAFLNSELFKRTLAAVAQRGGVYKPDLVANARKPVHRTLRKVLDGMTAEYARPISEEVHTSNIVKLSRQITSQHSNVLHKDKFRIGSAQKALNLHLKYRWCLGQIPEPPHCPFDFGVLSEIPGWQTYRWTEMAAIKVYRRLVEAARDVAGNQSLATWELELYNRLPHRQMDARSHR